MKDEQVSIDDNAHADFFKDFFQYIRDSFNNKVSDLVFVSYLIMSQKLQNRHLQFTYSGQTQ